jgi:hypothetical protein
MGSYIVAPGGTMNAGDVLTSPLGLCTLKFTLNGQLTLTYNNVTTNLTPNIHGGTVCYFTRTQLEIGVSLSATPQWYSPPAGACVGLDVQDNGQAVIYYQDGSTWVVGSAAVTPDVLVSRTAQVRASIDQLQMRFSELSADVARYLAADRPKSTGIDSNGAVPEYNNKPVTGMRPRALDLDDAENTGT